jgi:hypothetical protein
MHAPAAKIACHWDYVQGPRVGGTATRSMVWICEYPYRTARIDGPCEECPGRCERSAATANAALQRAVSRVLPFRDVK